MRLSHFLNRWNHRARAKMAAEAWLGRQEPNTCWMPTPNLYKEYDIGTKNVRWMDGKMRSVKTRKVRDTAGFTFYSFDTEVAFS